MKFCVIGLESFGSQVARALSENNVDVIAVDENEDKIEEIQNNVNQSICLNLSDEEALQSIGLEETDGVIISLENDFAQAVKVLRNLKKQFNEDLTIIVQAQNQTEKEILEIIGADQVIVPDQDSALRLADNLSSSCPDLLRIDDEFSVIQIEAPDKFVGKTMKDIGILENYNVHYIARKIEGQIEVGNPDDIIEEGNTLVIAGKKDDLEEIIKL